MNAPDFRTVFAGVRPARLAVLINQDDLDWQDTCRRIIECLASLWGGKHSIIVPTDGSHIDETFWEILEAFDPDYICEYHKTGLDVKIASPSRHEAQLQLELENAAANQAPQEGLRAALDDALCNSMFPPLGITPQLTLELKERLAPFYFQDCATECALSTRSEPGYPLTKLSMVLPNCEHPDQLFVAHGAIEGIPPLWVDSVLGGTYQEQTERIQSCGVTIEHMALGLEDAYRLMVAQLACTDQKPPDYLVKTPFALTMADLSVYRSLPGRFRESRAIVVVGLTLRDFALYFGLSRMRTGVSWLLPAWLETFKAASARQQNGGEGIRASERHACGFADALLRAINWQQTGPIDFVSVSVGKQEIEGMIDDLHSAKGSSLAGVTIKSQSRVPGGVTELLANPQVVFNTDNYAVPTTQQVVEGKAAGFFPTPKPKGFTRIVPYEHRWISELRVEGLSYPRHLALGEWLIRHPLLGTQGARTGKYGLCYICPNVAYFGGDVDTILIRPELSVPPAQAVFERVAKAAGLSCALSDKGFFSRDLVLKMGGLEYAAALLREPRHFAVLETYLIDGKAQSAAGRYLSSDGRRYLSLGDVSTILGDPTEAVSLIDTLVEGSLVRRGTVLKCQYCRTADWFSMGDLADGFICKRCARKQAIQRKHTLGTAEPVWYYQLDEIAYQGIRNDMHVPLLTLDYLRRKNKSFSYADELEIWKPNEPKPFIEIDLCCICDGTLTIGEAKTTERIEGGGKRERQSLAKYREAAVFLGARRFVLATSKVWSHETLSNAERAFAGTNVPVVHLDATQILAAT